MQRDGGFVGTKNVDVPEPNRGDRLHCVVESDKEVPFVVLSRLHHQLFQTIFSLRLDKLCRNRSCGVWGIYLYVFIEIYQYMADVVEFRGKINHETALPFELTILIQSIKFGIVRLNQRNNALSEIITRLPDVPFPTFR